ncbi:MAG: N-acetylmannosamine-6-phosphate 2-epimerase, partial [Micromonosporaceae bacterium]|nr:N-acetylmannosamine-6-phosphate 2-epimerase [Micromonosporaceae bacterium]
MTGSIETLRGGLVVSCQAPPGHPLRESPVIARLAQCAAIGGARGVRVNGPADIRAVKSVVNLPVIGLYKVAAADRDLITPRFDLAEELAEAGADVIAFEATDRLEVSPEKMISRIHEQLGLPAMAD